MKKQNPHAVKLGRLAKGKPKTLSPQERKRRAETMKQNQTKRWIPLEPEEALKRELRKLGWIR